MPYSVDRCHRAALLFCHDFHRHHRRTPTREELRFGLGYAGRGAVQHLVAGLEERGWLSRDHHGRITLTTPRPAWRDSDGLLIDYAPQIARMAAAAALLDPVQAFNRLRRPAGPQGRTAARSGPAGAAGGSPVSSSVAVDRRLGREDVTADAVAGNI